MIGEKPLGEGAFRMNETIEDSAQKENKNAPSHYPSCCVVLFGLFPCEFIFNCSSPKRQSSENELSEDGVFYCSICKVEVCQSIRFSSTASTVEFVTSVLTTSIITAGGSITV